MEYNMSDGCAQGYLSWQLSAVPASAWGDFTFQRSAANKRKESGGVATTLNKYEIAA